MDARVGRIGGVAAGVTPLDRQRGAGIRPPLGLELVQVPRRRVDVAPRNDRFAAFDLTREVVAVPCVGATRGERQRADRYLPCVFKALVASTTTDHVEAVGIAQNDVALALRKQCERAVSRVTPTQLHRLHLLAFEFRHALVALQAVELGDFGWPKALIDEQIEARIGCAPPEHFNLRRQIVEAVAAIGRPTVKTATRAGCAVLGRIAIAHAIVVAIADAVQACACAPLPPTVLELQPPMHPNSEHAGVVVVVATRRANRPRGGRALRGGQSLRLLQ
ncbi:MAG: hypothetical protein EBZ91_00400 [Gammaproteobacteria bacterium]|nr:hypothetical protein [Gammaproteobacteria bacterium]